MNTIEYYYSDGINQFGPCSKEELKKINIKNDTLVWCNGMETWKRASEIPELQDIFKQTPPPIPNQTTPIDKTFDNPAKVNWFNDNSINWNNKLFKSFSLVGIIVGGFSFFMAMIIFMDYSVNRAYSPYYDYNYSGELVFKHYFYTPIHDGDVYGSLLMVISACLIAFCILLMIKSRKESK